MQSTPEQIQAAEWAVNREVMFSPMLGNFRVGSACVASAEHGYACEKCGTSNCAHSLTARAIDSAFAKAREARRFIDDYLQVLRMAQVAEGHGFAYDTLEIEIRAARHVKATMRGRVMPIERERRSPHQEQRLRELGGESAGLTYREAKAEILRLEWNIWE